MDKAKAYCLIIVFFSVPAIAGKPVVVTTDDIDEIIIGDKPFIFYKNVDKFTCVLISARPETRFFEKQVFKLIDK